MTGPNEGQADLKRLFFFNVVKEDINFKKISAIAQISTLETSISGESARVAQLTEEIDTLEKDIAARKSEFSRCDRDLRETVGGISRGQQNNN